MRKVIFLALAFLVSGIVFSQKYNLDSALTRHQFQRDSTLTALRHQRDSAFRSGNHADSEKVEKDYKETTKWDNIKGKAIYPLINAGDNSGVIPVKDATEVPDPTIQYKLL